MGENCCLCFPIDCGVKTLGVLTMLGTIGLSFQTYANPDYKNIFLPFAVLSGIMSLIWIFTFMSPSESSKKAAFLGYLVLMLVGCMGYQGYLLMNGTLVDFSCNDHTIEHLNEAGQEIAQETGEQIDTVTEEDCKLFGKKGLIADFCIKLLLTIYFTYVIMKWSQNSDGYHK